MSSIPFVTVIDCCLLSANDTNHQKSIKFDESKAGDAVMIEIDIRSSTPSERTMHLFINGTQQKPYATNLPPSLLHH